MPTNEQWTRALHGLEDPTPSWSPEWPTEPGWYWFYGKRFRSSDKDELHPVQVYGTASPDVKCYAAGSAFIYEESATGLWLPLETPELPEEETP